MIQHEQERGKSLSPFERLEDRFNKLPEGEDKRYSDERKMKLEDGTMITIDIRRLFPSSPLIDHYSVIFEFPGHLLGGDTRKNPDNQAFNFDVGEDGLLDVWLPDLILKIGDTDISRRQTFISLQRTIGKETCISAAETLVDWFDKVVKEGKYSKPPVSASIFRY